MGICARARAPLHYAGFEQAAKAMGKVRPARMSCSNCFSRVLAPTPGMPAEPSPQPPQFVLNHPLRYNSGSVTEEVMSKYAQSAARSLWSPHGQPRAQRTSPALEPNLQLAER